MKWKGIELQRFNSDKPVIFDPPKKMLVWNSVEGESSLTIDEVIAYIPIRNFHGRKSVICKLELYRNCAEIPEEPKPRMATWKELAYWLMDGKGLVVDENTSRVDTGVFFNRVDLDAEVSDNLKVMRRDDTDWHKPTVDYLGLEV